MQVETSYGRGHTCLEKKQLLHSGTKQAYHKTTPEELVGLTVMHTTDTSQLYTSYVHEVTFRGTLKICSDNSESPEKTVLQLT